MPVLPRLRSWLRSLTNRPRLEQTLDDELRFHLDSTTADLINQGHTPEEARRLAGLALGASTAAQKEDCRASLGLRLYDELRADARYALRLLRNDPLLSTIAIASMALAIGANTALFSVAKTVLFDTLGVPHPEQLRLLHWQFAGVHQPVPSIWGLTSTEPNGNFSSDAFSYPVYQALAQRTDLFDGIAAFKNTRALTTVIDRQATSENGGLVSGNFFDVFRVSTIAGRPLTPADDRPNVPPVAVLSYDFWVNRFAQSPAAIGRTIRLNSVPVTIVGVAPPAFLGPQLGSPARLFLPVTLQNRIDPTFDGDQLRNGDSWWLVLIGRLKPNISDARARAALNAIFRQTARATLSNRRHYDLHKLALTLNSGSRGEDLLQNRLARPVAILFSLVGLVLLLACTNVANLLVARSTARTREISVRQALGASRSRLVRQMFVESLLLSTLAAFAGLLLAFVFRRALPYLLDIAAPPSFDWQILAFTAALALFTGLLFGLAPALHVLRDQSTVHLNETSRMTTSRPKTGLRKSLVIFQIALSTILLIGAALFVRTLSNLLHAELGFQPQHLLLFDLQPVASRYDGEARIHFYQQIEDRLRALPGVRDVTFVDTSLLSGGTSTSNFDRNDQPHRDGTKAWENIVGDTFFQTVGIPLRQGRSFNSQDTAHTQRVAVVNRQLARTYYPHEDPIGKTFNDDIRIVGICADAKYSSLRETAPPTFFLPYSQQRRPGSLSALTVYLKTAANPLTLASAARKTIAALDPELPLVNIRTQEQQIDNSLSHERLFATLTSAFGALALFLAAIGIYGVMSYTVARRTNEVGIRLALGAQTRQILQMMMTEGLLLALAGCAIGIAAALYLTRYLRSQFYAVTPHDPAILLAAAALLLACAALAIWLPARRATRISPTQALRHQ